MSTSRQEWDWPPKRTSRRSWIAAGVTIETDRTVATRKSLGTIIARGYLQFVWTLLRVLLAIVASLVFFGSVWLLFALFSR